MNRKHILFLLMAWCLLSTVQTFSQTRTFYWTDTITEDRRVCISRQVLFRIAKDQLLDSSLVRLDSIVQFMNVNKKIGLTVNVHSDGRGNLHGSSSLCRRRAMTIVDYLVQKGISRDRLVAKGWENVKPLIKPEIIQKIKNKEEQEALYAKNRRIEFITFVIRDTFLVHGRIENIQTPNETLSFAEIRIYKEDSLVTATMSDVDGNFSCRVPKLGTYNFIAKYLGCRTDTSRFWLTYESISTTFLMQMKCDHIICYETKDNSNAEIYYRWGVDKPNLKQDSVGLLKIEKIFVYELNVTDSAKWDKELIATWAIKTDGNKIISTVLEGNRPKYNYPYESLNKKTDKITHSKNTMTETIGGKGLKFKFTHFLNDSGQIVKTVSKCLECKFESRYDNVGWIEYKYSKGLLSEAIYYSGNFGTIEKGLPYSKFIFEYLGLTQTRSSH